MDKENILVTGGAGFIGSHVVERLLSTGNKVICVDNFDPYYSIEIKKKNIENALKNESFQLEECDIRDKDSIKRIFQSYRIDSIVHLAARAGVRPSIADPLLYQDVNIRGTMQLLEICREYNIRNFIFASSSSVYGDNDSVPFREDDKLSGPVSPYAASKVSGELICYTYHSLYRIPISCLRFFTVYGPRQRPDMAIHKFIKLIDHGKDVHIFGDGTSKRDYTFVSDIVDGVTAALDRPSGYEIFNLGNSGTIELKELIAVIEKHVGKKAKIQHQPNQPGDVSITYADISKSTELLDYHPKVKIEDGIVSTVQWYKNNGAVC